MKIDIENAIQQEPVQAIMMLCMRYLTDEQRKIVHEKLGRRVSQDPAPESLVKEAADLYPYPDKEGFEDNEYGYEMIRERINRERSAYIAGREKSLGRIRELEEVLSKVHSLAKRGIFPHLPVEVMGAQMCIDIEKLISESGLVPKQHTDGNK